MLNQFFTKLSQNYIEILKDNEYYDVTIEVGENPNVKIFRAHMIILCYRSGIHVFNLLQSFMNQTNYLSLLIPEHVH